MSRIITPGARDPRDPREALDYALQHHPQHLQVSRLEDLAVSWRRAPRDRNGRAGAAKGAVTLELLDELVKNQRGPESERDLFVLIKIPAAVLREKSSRIVIAR